MNDLIYLGQFSVQEKTDIFSQVADQIIEGDYLNLVTHLQQVEIFWHDIKLGVLKTEIDKIIYQLIRQHVPLCVEVIQSFTKEDPQIHFNINMDLTNYSV